MFKQFYALIRGRSYESVEYIVDRNALPILRQQIRDCANAVDAARRAVAIAIAQNELEERQHKKIIARIDDLEKRTIKAIEQGKDDLAHEAAETIAILEAERDASETAQQNFNSEISRLKRIVEQSQMRLRELQRGQRMAAATDKTQRLRNAAPQSGLSALKDAEETLQRLQIRQKQIDATTIAIDEMANSSSPASISEKLADAGCGAPIKSSADDVLTRLTKRAKKKSS